MNGSHHPILIVEDSPDDLFILKRSFKIADIRAELTPGTGAGTCPWKGEWKHLDVTIANKTIANGAWTYFETKPVTTPTKDFVAFYETKFDVTT